MWRNQQHTFRDLARGKDFSGTIIEVNQEGKLIIHVDQNQITWDFKEIAFVR